VRGRNLVNKISRKMVYKDKRNMNHHIYHRYYFIGWQKFWVDRKKNRLMDFINNFLSNKKYIVEQKHQNKKHI
jgi:hypothetical protein